MRRIAWAVVLAFVVAAGVLLVAVPDEPPEVVWSAERLILADGTSPSPSRWDESQLWTALEGEPIEDWYFEGAGRRGWLYARPHSAWWAQLLGRIRGGQRPAGEYEGGGWESRGDVLWSRWRRTDAR